MQKAKERLERHRARAMKAGTSAAEYAKSIGLSPQRIGRLLKDDPATPTLREALQLQAACKIKPGLWLQE